MLSKAFLLLFLMEFVHVDGVLHLLALHNRWLVKLLTVANFLDDASFLGLSLELFESSLNVFALFYRYNNHYNSF